MSITDRIINALQEKNPLCDDCLSEKANVKPRQTINSYCRRLSEKKEIIRNCEICLNCKSRKIVNRYLGANIPILSKSLVPKYVEKVRSWSWEGNIQKIIVENLYEAKWTIVSQANTSSRESGVDIVAHKRGKDLLVTVKGIPEKSQNQQARHWFAEAIFDIVQYRERNPTASLAIGLPEFVTYQNLIPKVSWLQRVTPFSFLIVRETGEIYEPQPETILD